MAPMADLLPGDNPQAYIPGDRRRALARGEELPRLAHGQRSSWTSRASPPWPRPWPASSAADAVPRCC